MTWSSFSSEGTRELQSLSFFDAKRRGSPEKAEKSSHRRLAARTEQAVMPVLAEKP